MDYNIPDGKSRSIFKQELIKHKKKIISIRWRFLKFVHSTSYLYILQGS